LNPNIWHIPILRPWTGILPYLVSYIFSSGSVKQVITADGVTGMWTGLGASLLRTCSYTTIRLGAYRKMEESYTPKTFVGKLTMGGSAGFIGSLFGNPADVCLIRMCADGNLPKAEQRGYTSVFNALSRIM